MKSGGPSERNRGAEAARVLYVTYDGLTDPLGQSQILPYLTRLSQRGHRITILSCEKRAAMDKEGAAIRKLCESNGLDWQPLPYHKNPPVLSSMLDLAILKRSAAQLHRAQPFGLVHCRSYIPAAAGLHLKRRFGVPLLFDMRGFWPEEKTEGGSWDLRNPLFRLVNRYFKGLESRLLQQSDAIVSLTEAGRTELLRRSELSGHEDRISVIPCCVDFGHFRLAGQSQRRAARQQLGIAPDARVLAYLGSLGGNYMLGEMLEFFRAYRKRNAGARFLFVTQELPELIVAEARKRDIGVEELVIRAASREHVPHLLAAADLGIAFKQPSFSAKGCSPTKMGEMLAVGIPFIANSGVGDVAEQIAETGGGVVVERFDEAAYAEALDRLERLGADGERWRELARSRLDLEQGIDRYDSVYRSIIRTGALTGDITKQGR